MIHPPIYRLDRSEQRVGITTNMQEKYAMVVVCSSERFLVRLATTLCFFLMIFTQLAGLYCTIHTIILTLTTEGALMSLMLRRQQFVDRWSCRQTKEDWACILRIELVVENQLEQGAGSGLVGKADNRNNWESGGYKLPMYCTCTYSSKLRIRFNLWPYSLCGRKLNSIKCLFLSFLCVSLATVKLYTPICITFGV